ncbi:hypothetical protein RE680_16220 [Serratia marcescens]|jgi:hypothetical protein|uniref:Uncharacterized protein n=1 Tax=Serratia surfactantfaciens TaxID=2741499 RepID=A0ABS0M2K8_9GAMM|nr:hypothetical protein [Serratia surfactantfaciens]MBH1921799.1 hypothetical protein [Serratia surfactantfaciens]WMW60091.1 hypothetical protein RE680_16220 [Serratia marcescens]
MNKLRLVFTLTCFSLVLCMMGLTFYPRRLNDKIAHTVFILLAQHLGGYILGSRKAESWMIDKR